MKIYDCFTFFNELDLLEIRLNELDEIVDYFVIVEGKNTFQSKPKELFFENNKKRYEKFLKKIIHVIIPSENLSSNNPWDNERVSFDSIHLGIKNASDDDLIIISAVDEIPSVDSIKKACDFNSTCKIVHQFFYFYLNTKYWISDNHNTTWNGSCFTKYSDIKNREIRDWFENTRSSAHGIHGGWHFSFLGDEKNAFTKVNSYSHSEYNNLDENFYKENMENLKDPFGRSNIGFHSFEEISNLPNYIQNNLSIFDKNIRK